MPFSGNHSDQDADKQSSDLKRYLSFSLGTESYAVPLLTVKEVIAMPDITPIPYTPPHFLGMMNLRGQVISVIDLRAKLSIKHQDSAQPAVIICDFKTLSIGVVVSDVTSVLSLADKEVQPRPQIDSKQKADYITGVTQKGGKFVILLDLSKMLNLEEFTAAKQSVGA